MSLTNIKITPEEEAEIIRKLLEDEPLVEIFDAAGFAGIEFEPKSPRGNDGEKVLFTYGESLERKAAGYSRHARPSEAFSFLIAGLENRLSPSQKAIADDMLASYGEWLSMACQRKKDKIIFYSDPENLKWDGSKYAADGRKLICSDENEFPLAKDVSASSLIGLDKFDDGLVQFLYSRPFAQLPKEMQDGSKKARLYLPPKNTLWPLGRGVHDGYSVCGFGYSYGASRWVAVRKKIP